MTTNRKRHLKSEFAQLQTSSILFNFILFGKCQQNFLGLNPKGLYLSLEEEKDNFCAVFTDFIKWAREIRKFHVAQVKWQQRNVKNNVIHVQICCLVNKNLLLFCRSSSLPSCRWFCYHPEIVLPWWSDIILLLSINHFNSSHFRANWKVENSIHLINLYPVDSANCFP